MSLSEVDRLSRRIYPNHDNTGLRFTDFSEIDYAPPAPKHERLGKAAKWLGKAGARAVSGLRVAIAPTLQQAKDHLFTIAAMTCFDWAAFLWNDKAGLITTGVAFILFELKVSSS
jgi:hypothetical protein